MPRYGPGMTTTRHPEFWQTLADHAGSEFTSPEVCDLAGCTYRQLDHWVRRGLISAPRISDVGSGRLRKWNFESVLEAVVVSRLSRGGIRIDRLLDEDVISFAQRLIEDLEDILELAMLADRKDQYETT